MDATEIKLKTGETAVIDAEDEPRIASTNWGYYRTSPGSRPTIKCYVASTSNPRQYLHRVIMGAAKFEIVDHIDGNTLDCRKSNLRLVSSAGNARNRAPHKSAGRTSKYKGVCWDKKAGKWLATIYANGVLYRLGVFTDDQLAAATYDDASHALHGEFGFRNFAARTPQPIELKAPKKREEGYGWHTQVLRGEKIIVTA